MDKLENALNKIKRKIDDETTYNELNKELSAAINSGFFKKRKLLRKFWNSLSEIVSYEVGYLLSVSSEIDSSYGLFKIFARNYMDISVSYREFILYLNDPQNNRAFTLNFKKCDIKKKEMNILLWVVIFKTMEEFYQNTEKKPPSLNGVNVAGNSQ